MADTEMAAKLVLFKICLNLYFNNIKTMFAKIIITILSTMSVVMANASVAYTVKSVPNVQIADRNNLVSNPDNILSASAVDSINSILVPMRSKGVAEIAVVVLDRIDEGEDSYFFAHNLFNEWGVGKKGKDNGVVIYVNKQLRDIQIEVGYGLEGTLPDAVCKRIISQTIAPELKKGNWDKGLEAGVGTMCGILNGDTSLLAADNEQSDNLNFLAPIGFIFVIVLFLAVIFVASLFEKRCNNCGKKNALRRVKSEVIANNAMRKTILTTYRCKYCGHTETKRTIEQKSVYIGGGGFGGGGFGGGGSFGGGFGGGMSGGGGARGGF